MRFRALDTSISGGAVVKSESRNWFIIPAVAFLLLLLASELALSVRRESQTWDEACHIFDGYNRWKTGDAGMNPEHPPLVKLLATAPLLSLPLHMPQIQDREFKESAFFAGHDFLYSNDADQILFRVRMAAGLLTLVLALFLFTATREMFGLGPAFLALTLFVFEPTLLAHGTFVTTDMAMACWLFATVYAFYRYVKKPSVLRMVLVGVAAGLGLASKHSAVLILPILLLLALVEVMRKPDEADIQSAANQGRGKRSLRLAGSLALAGVIALGVLWSFYGFRYPARPAGLSMSPPLTEFAGHLKHPAESTTILTLARWKLLPEAYLYGMADVVAVADFSPSYLFGKVYRHGQWFYFPAALVIKSTLTLLLLLLLLPVAIMLRRGSRRELLFLIIPAGFYFGVAMASGLNIGVRHILPVYPFLCVLAGFSAWTIAQAHRRWAYLVAAVFLLNAVSSLRSFPVYLAYSNELWGGPSNTYKLLTDSNTDWGQQLHSTKRYLDQRGVKQCWFAYFAAVVADPAYYGIPCKPLTTIASFWLRPEMEIPPSIDGPVLISAGVLSGYEFGPGELNPYAQFQKLPPTAIIDHGIFVFDGHFEIPLASALNHTTRAGLALQANNLDQALTEAQTAAALAPNSAITHATLGRVLAALKRPDEARAQFQQALVLAETIEPDYQKPRVEGLRKAAQ